jgi:hypothetical protein
MAYYYFLAIFDTIQITKPTFEEQEGGSPLMASV